MCVHQSFDKLIWRTIGPKNFLFGTAQFSLWASGTVSYDYIVTNTINSLLIGSRCIPNGAHTNHWGIWRTIIKLTTLADEIIIEIGDYENMSQ